MSLINRFKKELFLKILYTGPSKSGKSENLRAIFKETQGAGSKGGFLVHQSDPPSVDHNSLFFDFLPLTLGTIADFNVRLHLFSVPGQGKYDAVTRLVLRGVDGIVFVAPSLPDRLTDTQESLTFTKQWLGAYGKPWNDVPVVFQYSFRDSPRALAPDLMRQLLNPEGSPEILADVSRGLGVMDTVRRITHEALHAFKAGSRSVDGPPTTH